MAANKKLTGVIKGRTITNVSQSDDTLMITFGDNSTMRVKTGAPPATPSTALPADALNALKGKTMDSVQQQGTTLNLTFADKSSQHLSLAEATSSVMVRDASGKMEYAD